MMNELTVLIADWAYERDLEQADPSKQMLKLMEEVGELAEGMAKDKQEQVKDSLGDIYVVLIILSLQLGLNFWECVDGAYKEIKDRRGKMVNGVFVKESDLKEVEG